MTNLGKKKNENYGCPCLRLTVKKLSILRLTTKIFDNALHSESSFWMSPAGGDERGVSSQASFKSEPKYKRLFYLAER